MRFSLHMLQAYLSLSSQCVRALNLNSNSVSSKQLSVGNRYRKYIKTQVPSCERGITLCSKGGGARRGCVVEVKCCRICILSIFWSYSSEHSLAIMIDSFGISEGTCARGEPACLHICTGLHSLANVIRFFLLLTLMCCVHGWPETRATWERRR